MYSLVSKMLGKGHMELATGLSNISIITALCFPLLVLNYNIFDTGLVAEITLISQRSSIVVTLVMSIYYRRTAITIKVAASI